jgi:hypothetical protein
MLFAGLVGFVAALVAAVILWRRHYANAPSTHAPERRRREESEARARDEARLR